ncbi:MAG: 50S ribosomal protein L11 methyltransferase [Bacteriovoracales bacterium]
MEKKYYYLLEVNFKKISELEYFKINGLAFEDFNCQGVEEFNLSEREVDEILGKDALLGAEVSEAIIEKIEKSVESGNIFLVKYLFLKEEEAKSFQDFLSRLESPPATDLKRNIFEDWNQEWKKHFKSIDISPRLKVIPEWERDQNLEGKIIINPGMGFGTGSHETTFLCLKFLDELNSPLKKCLDFGCGSGILGIAAIKLFNSEVDFVDVSKEALSNCYENLCLNFDPNSLEGSSVVIRDHFKADKKYDLIFANILMDILIGEKDTILKCLNSKGKIIISGLLNEQKDEFLKNFSPKNTLKVVESKSKGDWCAILLERI